MNSTEVLRLSNGNFFSFETVFAAPSPGAAFEQVLTVTLHGVDGSQIGDPLRLRVGELPEAEVGLYRNSVEFSIAQPDGGAVIYLNETTDGIFDFEANTFLVSSTFSDFIVRLDAQGVISSVAPLSESLALRGFFRDPGTVISLSDGSGLIVHNVLAKVSADGTVGDVFFQIDPAEMTAGTIINTGAVALPDGGFFAIGYTDPSARASTGNFLYGSFVDADLAAVGDPIVLLDDTFFPEAIFGELDDYAILRLPNGRIAIAVNTYDSADALSRVSEMTLLILNPDGTVNTPAFRANGGGERAARQFEPELFLLSDGGFALAYQTGNEFAFSIDLHVRRFSADGVFQEEIVVVDGGIVGGFDPDIVELHVNPNGDILFFGVSGDAALLGQLAVGTVVEPEPTDVITGTDGDDTLAGTDGDDQIAAGAGNDSIDGGAGSDSISSSDGNDQAIGGAGNDNIGGGQGDDTIDGGAGDDIIGGGFGADSITGGAGNDVVAGGADNDTLSGGDGNDSMSGSFGNDSIDGGEGADDIGGGTGRDTIDAGAGDDRVGGGEGDDSILGGDGDDFLAGGGRNDLIDGGAGSDTINAGAGNDTITGGADADLFVFSSFFDGEADIITDFEDGSDSFLIRRFDPDTGVENINNGGNGLAGFVAAMNIVDVAGGAQMTVGGNTILVEGVTAAQLTVDDFTFL
ncbi:calcium-binding protein [Roseovarius mucosus]|uniref:calcium-binding protein n=1 Tax=Roseovarius mucosus TaxID=215743 RepID=UPI003F70020C